MDSTTFYRRFVASLPSGTILQNPGGGTTEIIDYAANDRLVYQRGQSRIYVSIRDLYAAYRSFSGQTVSSTDLREYAPDVFDSKRGGHSCNCTVLFTVATQ